ncbi:MAG: PBP1A family penicillin-binding protein [Verrucomicrobiota bacterium]|nr:PBP1A family penicillin-binding protein [Verrucomicrobiota bacterium]
MRQWQKQKKYITSSLLSSHRIEIEQFNLNLLPYPALARFILFYGKMNPDRKIWLKKYVLLPLAISAFVVFAVVAVSIIYYSGKAATYDMKEVGIIPERSFVYDNSGKMYSRMGGENRVVVPLGKVSPNFKNALLGREDRRFHKHGGVDFYGTARALVRNVKSGSIREGGSTLTQQLARNSFDLRDKSYRRKILEVFLAWRIEKHYSKEQILEFYVNRIYFGSGVWGIETASQFYFGKNAENLTLSEGALLAGLIKSPNVYSPFKNLEKSIHERDEVLNSLVKYEIISAHHAEEAKKEVITLARKRAFPFEENYAIDVIRHEVSSLIDDDQIDLGGLKIFTTIEPKLQEGAEKTLNEFLNSVENRKGFKHTKKKGEPDKESNGKTKYLQGALIAIDNKTGGILAMVGGRDYDDSKYNRATQARRQVGSTFKPFVYALAFESGLNPESMVDDGPIQPGELGRSYKNWRPENSDGQHKGLQPAGLGLVHSRNTMTVRVAQNAGFGRVVSLAKSMGLGDNIPDYPSTVLGSFETTLTDLTAAYTSFPNEGKMRKAYVIKKIEDAKGNVLYLGQSTEQRVFSRESAGVTSGLMEMVMETGTASKARSLGFKGQGGGKTGTTNDYKDAWFVGFTPGVTCGVWVGFDDPQTIMKKGYGSELALPIWVNFVKKLPGKLTQGSYYAVRPNLAPPPIINPNENVYGEVSGIMETLHQDIKNIFGTTPRPVEPVPNNAPHERVVEPVNQSVQVPLEDQPVLQGDRRVAQPPIPVPAEDYENRTPTRNNNVFVPEADRPVRVKSPKQNKDGLRPGDRVLKTEVIEQGGKKIIRRHILRNRSEMPDEGEVDGEVLVDPQESRKRN